MALILPSLCSSEVPTGKGRTAKGHLGSSPLPRRISDLLTGGLWGSSHVESPNFLLSWSISGAQDTRGSSRPLPHTTLEVQCFDIIFLI